MGNSCSTSILRATPEATVQAAIQVSCSRRGAIRRIPDSAWNRELVAAFLKVLPRKAWRHLPAQFLTTEEIGAAILAYSQYADEQRRQIIMAIPPSRWNLELVRYLRSFLPLWMVLLFPEPYLTDDLRMLVLLHHPKKWLEYRDRFPVDFMTHERFLVLTAKLLNGTDKALFADLGDMIHHWYPALDPDKEPPTFHADLSAIIKKVDQPKVKPRQRREIQPDPQPHRNQDAPIVIAS